MFFAALMVGIAVAPTASATGGVAGNLAKPKSRIFAWPRRSDENVRRLDVAMDDALGVRGVQGVGKLDAQLQDLSGLEGPWR